MSCIPHIVLNYSDKVNIYKNECFITLPAVLPPPPPAIQLYRPTNECNIPYSTPTYTPPYASCTECKTCSCKK
jgi:hypothetical protein